MAGASSRSETARRKRRVRTRVWDRLDTWGIAGHRMYWKPILQVQVQPGGDARYAELARLLDGSGIIVKRK